MEESGTTIKLEYNTEREKLAMPEYGRNILKMVEKLSEIEDRDERSRQAAAVVKVMELLNPQVHNQDNYEQKLWDHLHIISGYTLDVDSPYPVPREDRFDARPAPVPMKGERIRATHYGRNIEKIINLLCEQPDDEIKTETIRSLAIYMRQQYLIWNKDSVADETICQDIERLSDGRIKVPEGIQLGRVGAESNYLKPGQNPRKPMNQKKNGKNTKKFR